MKARARRDDPATSHEAAAIVEKTKAPSHREILKAYVLANPGLTSAEIAAAWSNSATCV